MKLPGAAGQQIQHFLYKADITLTGSAQLVLGRSLSRTCLILQNTGAHVMYVEIGFGAATATLASGAVTSVSVTNSGFGYTKPPLIRFLGGGYPGGTPGGIGYNTSYLGLGQPNAPQPSNVATAVATLSGGSIGSITVNNGGASYAAAPYVQILGSDLDPNGCATPSSSSGYVLEPPGSATANGSTLRFDATFCPTDPISVLGTSGDVLLCRWAD